MYKSKFAGREMRNCGIVAMGLLVAIGVSACNQSKVSSATTSVNTTLATAEADAQKAHTFYGVVKGLAEVAEFVPGVTAAEKAYIDTTIKVLDPIDAQLATLISDVNTNADTIEALVAQVNDEAITLENAAAPSIKVISNK